MLLAWMLACAPPDEAPEEACAGDWPDAPSEPDTVLANDDDCGWWTLPVGDQLVVSVYVTEALIGCAGEADDGLDLPYDPSYTNLDGDGPKYTFQVKAVAPTGDAWAAFDATCGDDTEWHARVQVVE